MRLCLHGWGRGEVLRACVCVCESVGGSVEWELKLHLPQSETGVHTHTLANTWPEAIQRLQPLRWVPLCLYGRKYAWNHSVWFDLLRSTVTVGSCRSTPVQVLCNCVFCCQGLAVSRLFFCFCCIIMWCKVNVMKWKLLWHSHLRPLLHSTNEHYGTRVTTYQTGNVENTIFRSHYFI